MQNAENRNEKSGILIEYQTYNHFWQTCFAENEVEAKRIVTGLKKLKHVTKISYKEKLYN